jgi:hypothetical protein
MIKLSEIIRTDCYIDCGSNEKLREVVSILESKYKLKRWLGLGVIEFDDIGIAVFGNDLDYLTAELNLEPKTPTHHISQIDLNG